MLTMLYVLWSIALLAPQAPGTGGISTSDAPGIITLIPVNNLTAPSLIPVRNLTTTVCGIGCLINAKYRSTESSSFIVFSEYSVTSALQSYHAGGEGSTGECLTTTQPPVTGTIHTISLETTLAGTKLDEFAASQIEDILGYSGCFAVAALTTLDSTSRLSSGVIATSGSIKLPSPSISLISTASTPKATSDPTMLKPGSPTVIALATILPVVTVLLLISGVFVYRRRKVSAAYSAAQSSGPAGDNANGASHVVSPVKPELHADQSRYELGAEQSRFEMSEEGDQNAHRPGARASSTRQELRGIEPSSELNT